MTLLGRAFVAGALATLTVAALLAGQPAPAGQPDLVLRTVLIGAEHHQTYQELPFVVPPGVVRVTVEVSYTGREERATVDLGLFDSERFRGWSGGNKSRFTLAETDATPSYLPGPLPPGTWRLVLGVPNLRPATRAEVEARITFGRESAPASAFVEVPLNKEPGWYRGDLHLHTGHSDGSCASQSGQRVPCPVYRTLEVAAERKLDFVAVSEHNATSHHQALRELQPYFDRLLLIPAREITTFYGHANVFGVERFLDFRFEQEPAKGLERLLDAVETAGGLIAINHPALPSGQVCMGCGWSLAGTDFGRFQAVEIVNGGALRSMAGRAEGPLSGIAFWQARLDQGYSLTAIGGSDNHDPTLDAAEPSAIGRPATVVWAEELSPRAILDGIRAGRVFVDLEGRPDRLLDISVRAGERSAAMGGMLEVGEDDEIRVRVEVLGGSGLEAVLRSGSESGGAESSGAEAADREAEAVRWTIASDHEARELLVPRIQGAPPPRWLRVELRESDGRLVLLGNAVLLVVPAVDDLR